MMAFKSSYSNELLCFVGKVVSSMSYIFKITLCHRNDKIGYKIKTLTLRKNKKTKILLERFFFIDWIKKSSRFMHGEFWIEDTLFFWSKSGKSLLFLKHLLVI